MIKHEILSKTQGYFYARTLVMWRQLGESIYYFIIDNQNIDLMEMNMLTQETKVTLNQVFTPQEVKILNEERTYQMEQVDAIIFVESMDGSSKDIQDQCVGLMCKDDGDELLYISFRKVHDINKELFTIALSIDESDNLYWKTISIS